VSGALIFVIVFVGLFVLRIVAATVVFYYILPRGDRCPMCDAVTMRVESKHLNRVLRSLRSSWCMNCGWSGMLRTGDLSAEESKTLAPVGTADVRR